VYGKWVVWDWLYLIHGALVNFQERINTMHPQLLYESKIYQILRGGGKKPGIDKIVCWSFHALLDDLALLCGKHLNSALP